MALSTVVREWLNRAVRPAGLQIGTLTADRARAARLAVLRARGHFDRPAFALSPGFGPPAGGQVFGWLAEFRADAAKLARSDDNAVGYSPDNGYFTTPDADVYYAVVRGAMPGRVVEVGSGNSTRVARQAILDGKLATQVVCVDPQPRVAVADFCDRHVIGRVEDMPADDLLALLGADGLLFIDSSHACEAGGDVPYLFCHLLPRLPAGTLVHVHDVFLPYDYPADWAAGDARTWDEQYLVHALLQGGGYEVLWPGYHLQRTLPGFAAHFSGGPVGQAQSLWLRKRAPAGR